MNDSTNYSEPKSLACELQVVRQAFPHSLFDGEGWERLLSRAANVPACLIENVFGFELRIGQPEPAADFCITLRADSNKALEFLNFAQDERYNGMKEPDKNPHRNLRTDSRRQHTNASLAKLLSELSTDGSFANKAVPQGVIVLEYDVVAPEVGQNPAPGVFWGLGEHVGPESMCGVVQMIDIAQIQHVNSSLDYRKTLSHSTEDARVASLRRIAEATMPYGRISQIGTFLGRDQADFRILIRIEDRSTIDELLHAIGWTGNIPKVIDLVSKFDFPDTSFGISLDVGIGGVGPKVGLEVSTKGGWIGTRIANWQPLIDVLVANGLCRADKGKGLQKWCGYMRLFSSEMYMLLKGINHLKISFQNEECLEAKAYLGACRVRAQDVGFE